MKMIGVALVTSLLKPCNVIEVWQLAKAKVFLVVISTSLDVSERQRVVLYYII